MKRDRVLANFVRAIKGSRNLKIFLGVAFIVFFLLAGVTIWASFVAFQQISTWVRTPQTQATLQSAAENLNPADIKLDQVKPVSCYNTALSLLSVPLWLENTPLTLLERLRVSCLGVTNANKDQETPSQENVNK